MSEQLLSEGKNLLLIDDDESVRMSFRAYLEDCGYRVLVASNGRAGLELFHQQPVDLILADLRMPEVNGLQVLEQVSRESPETPVIVISGMGTLADSVEALRLGAWDYLIKPVQEMAALAHAVSQALEKARLRRENREYREHLEYLVDERTGELRLRTEEARRSAEKLQIFSLAVEQSASAVVITDRKGRVEYVNRKFTEVTGYLSEEVIGQSMRLLKSEQMPAELFSELWSTISAGRVWRGELLNRRKSGDYYWDYVTITPIVSDAGEITHYLAIQDDITIRKEQERRLIHQANHDSLTGLPNRLLALDRLKQAVARSKRESAKGALMYLDLDGFKEINDQHGHETGDRLLVAVAARLKDCVRETDTVARIGGDEFLVILQGLESMEHSAYLAEKIHSLFLEPVSIDNRQFAITVSIGITYFPDDSRDPRELLRNADAAMYQAKQAGHNQSRCYTEG